MNCAECNDKECYQGKDCTKIKQEVIASYQDKQDRKLLEVSTEIEGRYYMKLCRLEELIEFSKKMGYKKLGVVFCIGLSQEAKILTTLLKKKFKVFSVCCKVCGIDKKIFNLKQINEKRYETICDPIGQAKILNKRKTDLNIILGLCMGHDILFSKHSQAPVTTLVVKDRVLAHNSIGAIYSRYYHNKLNKIYEE